MKKITTVRGDIAPEDLGYTSMHEHTFIDLRLNKNFLSQYLIPPPPEKMAFTLENYSVLKNGSALLSDEHSVTDVDQMDYVAREVYAFKELGGKSICDCSPLGIRGSVSGMQKLSELTGVNIVCATGLYLAVARPAEFIGASVEYCMSRFEQELTGGVDGTGIKPGFLKCAFATPNDNFEIEASELNAFRACARLAVQNGMSVHVHTAPPLPGEELERAVDIVLGETGLDPGRILLCHLDNILTTHVQLSDYIVNDGVTKAVDTDLQERLLGRGVNIGFDTWGSPIVSNYSFLPDDFDRLKGLIRLVNRGYASQITLGHDFCGKLYSLSYGNYGLTRFPTLIPEMFEMAGVDEAVFHKLTVENPARILAY